ncbi:hypothetical protein [Azospirillum sp. SYSU D00513]|uniref:hypothetical protein n=1 Tax=Azospirillum sp. SYSU D00513 TaxID=2812561 RepID=UPI001A95E3C0|nr:hypothetical protein [Azospirillum sp. SYSU D00513]
MPVSTHSIHPHLSLTLKLVGVTLATAVTLDGLAFWVEVAQGTAAAAPSGGVDLFALTGGIGLALITWARS